MELDDTDFFLSELTDFEFQFLSDLACRMSEPEIAEKHDVPISLVLGALHQIVVTMEVEDILEAARRYSFWIDEFEMTLVID